MHGVEMSMEITALIDRKATVACVSGMKDMMLHDLHRKG
jgi:hypothetical protein